MANWDLYTNRVTAIGNSRKEQYINKTKRSISLQSKFNPAFKEDILINGEPRSIFITATKQKNKKAFDLLPDEEINLGDEIYWQGQHWLVTEIDFDSTIQKKGALLQCNHLLKWQGFDKEIHEQWCILERPYTSGIYENKFITTSDKEYKLIITYNELTRKFYTNQRFLIEVGTNQFGEDMPLVYETITFDGAVNHYGTNKLLVLNIRQCESKTTDNIEIGVADYIEPTSNPTSEINCHDYVRVGRMLTGILTAGTSLSWKIIGLNDKVIIKESKENSFVLSVDNDFTIIGKSFVLRCNMENGEYIEKTILIKGLY